MGVRARRPLPSDQVSAAGYDAGCDTIVWHLRQHHDVSISRAGVHRILRAAGRIMPEPAKRPRASYIRFQAELPNELWQVPRPACGYSRVGAFARST